MFHRHPFLSLLTFAYMGFVGLVTLTPEARAPIPVGLVARILDALHYEKHPTHFSIFEALRAIERLRPKRAYLTHLSHRLDYTETNRKLPPGVELAYDGLQIPLT